MRLRITIQTDSARGLSVPINYQVFLTAAIYNLIARANPEYARFLHEDGFATEDGSGRRFKMFTYGRLDAPASRREIDKEQDRITFAPGPITWTLSSPVEEVIRNVAGGMLAAGMVQVGQSSLRIECIEVLPMPMFEETMKFTCVTPIVAARALPKGEGGGTHYVRPLEDPGGFSEAIRMNLVAKYRALTGREPSDARFEMMFDPAYLARAHHGAQKMVSYKGTQFIGTLAPFTAKGSADLIQTGYDCGYGGKNSLGMGCVEVVG